MSPRLRHGEPWGDAARGPADEALTGDDRDLAALAARRPGSLVRFRPAPTSDFGRAVGLTAGHTPDPTQGIDAPVDALRLGDGQLAVNAVVAGRAPDQLGWWSRRHHITVTLDGREWFAGRATTVLVANGQYLRGHDLVPRGHPGDGWMEVQVYALRRSQHAAMRRRLRTGTHVPHPGIRQGRARRVDVVVSGPGVALEVDGVGAGSVGELHVSVAPAAIRLLL